VFDEIGSLRLAEMRLVLFGGRWVHDVTWSEFGMNPSGAVVPFN